MEPLPRTSYNSIVYYSSVWMLRLKAKKQAHLKQHTCTSPIPPLSLPHLCRCHYPLTPCLVPVTLYGYGEKVGRARCIAVEEDRPHLL